MLIKNEMTLKFLAISQNESFARSCVAAFTTQLEPTVEEINDIKTAVSEAVTNSIVHAYQDKMGYVTVHAQIIENTVHIEVVDQGSGIADIEKAMQPLFTTKPEQERSGMGFTVMQTFMDNIKVKSDIGKGTSVKMVKKIGRPAKI